MQLPSLLQPGDTVAITCPSGYLPPERIVFAKQTLEAWGYKVITGTTIGSGHFYFSDTDERRLYDLQTQLDNPEVKAILMGRGGYGLSRIIDDIDFSSFIQNPKWICGFSDITVLHSHIQSNFNIATLHSPMCGAFKETEKLSDNLLSLQQAWTGIPYTFPVQPHAFNREGSAKGEVVGGNLAILAHLSGSRSQLNTEGKILFIEDIGEYLYNTDRLLLNLKRAGMLSGIKGLICGGFTDMQDTERPFGQTIYEIIKDKVADYGYPVCFDFPVGHQDLNYTLCLGKTYELNVTATAVSLI